MRNLLLVTILLLIVLPVLAASEPDLTAKEIVSAAHRAAGGDQWVRPRSLYLVGSSTFYDGHTERHYDRHEMWREYSWGKTHAHQADGRVRIRSSQGGVVRFDLIFDGETTYMNGEATDEPANSPRWASNFGFGVIRHALDPGYSLTRLPDDQVDATPSYTIGITDPDGGDTLFGIAMGTFEILKVGFDTPRGWHERIYSAFFTKPGSDWRQPGLVRLYYQGVKQNEVRWTGFVVDEAFDLGVFAIELDVDNK